MGSAKCAPHSLCAPYPDFMTRRRWIADTWNQTSAALAGQQAHHLAHVLRVRPGQQFDVVAGNQVLRGTVESVEDDCVRFALGEEVSAAQSLPLTVVLSIIRFEPMEWAIEKLTELGVQRMVPMAAQRSDRHLVQAARKRVERWRRIAREAAQQSRRNDVPEIDGPIELLAFLESAHEPRRLMLSEREEMTSLWDVLNAPLEEPAAITLAVGPEGGWTDAEMTLFTKHAWTPVSLGPRILRAETAAIAATSVLAARLNATA
jgi:16S rRNA (uracil1498-N3)-methyltransferase